MSENVCFTHIYKNDTNKHSDLICLKNILRFKRISLVAILFFFSLILAQNSDIEIYIEKGYEYFESDNFETAISFFSKAYDLDENIKEVNSMLGLSYLYNRNVDAAEIYFLNAVEIDSTVNNDYYNLACIYALRSNNDSSIEYLQKALYWGFIDYKHLVNDSDLDFIRKDKKYKDLIKGYFSNDKRERNQLLLEAEESVENENYNVAANKTYEFIDREKKSSEPRPILILNAYKKINDYTEYINWKDNDAKIESYKTLYENLIKYYTLSNLKPTPEMYYILGTYSTMSQPLNSPSDHNDYGLQALLEAKKIYNEQSNYVMEAIINNEIGELFLERYFLNSPNNSIPYFEKSLVYYKTIPDTANIIELNKNIAEAYVKINDLKNAYHYYEELSRFSILIKDEANYLLSLKKLYDLYVIMGVKEKVIEIGEKIINYPNEDTLFHHIGSTGLINIWTRSYYDTEQEIKFSYKGFPIIKRSFEKSGTKAFGTYYPIYKRMIDYFNVPSTIAIMEANNKFDQGKIELLIKDYYKEYYPNTNIQDANINDLFDSFMEEEFIQLTEDFIEFSIKKLDEENEKMDSHSPCEKLSIYTEKLIFSDWGDGSTTGLSEDYINSISKKAMNDLNECNNNIEVIQYYHALGRSYISIENYETAKDYLIQLLALLDEVKRNTPEEYKIDYFEQHLNVYKTLVRVYFSEELYVEGLNIYEIMRLREFNKQLLLDDQDKNFTTVKEDFVLMEKYLKGNTLIYYTINFDYSGDSKFAFKIFAFDRDSFAFGNITGWVNDYGGKTPSVLSSFYPDGKTTIKYAVKEFDNSMEIEDIESLVKIYLYHLKENSDLLENYSQLLYEILLSPVDHLIDKNKDLIIIPNHILSFLPFESLSDTNGIYLSQKANVKYIQSVKTLSRLKEQDRINKNSKILAIGGAIYNQDEEYKVEKISQSNTLINRGNLYSELNTRSNLGNYYKKIFGNEFPNLPGSYNEVLSIKGIFDKTDLLTGERANEKYLKKLSTTGELYNYDIIHFATHATVINEFPELSAIVLTQTNNETEDGFLNLGEVANLNINADYVTLSACETGLGNISISGGVDGLTQSFFIAGANSITVSLWAIDDEATSVFMDSFYKKLNIGVPISKSLNMTKIEFLDGKYGEEYKKPYYWAPFVYYGK